MLGTIFGSIMWMSALLAAWRINGWLGIATVVVAVGISAVGIISMSNDIEEKR